MKSVTKKISLAGLGAVCVLSLSLGAGMLAKTNNFAKAEENTANFATSYFYDNMLDTNNNEYTLAKKFYKVLEQLQNDGEFVDGVVDYNISDIVTSDQLKGWVEDGNLEVPKAFSAARDAFRTDHPELFYIDLYKMTISVATSGGQYVGYLNSGREANLYCDNGFNTKTDVEAAIEKFENRIDEIVEEVGGKWDESNVYVARDVFLAKEVNTYLAKNIVYDYVAYESMDDPNYIAAAYINTPYGGLVEGKAVCGGFSTAYKVVMDRLGIPCITVNGYSNNRDESGNNSGTSVYHMWNYVYLENPSVQSKARSARAASNGAWYSVDVTWDSSAYSITRFAVLSEPVDSEVHVTDGVISSGGYELVYPELSPYTYGGTVDTDGLQLTITYEETTSSEANDGSILYDSYYHASYNGKDAKRLLEEDGLYMAYRFAYYYPEYGQLEITWTNWFAIEYWRLALLNGNEGSENDKDSIQNTGNETRIYGNTSEYYIQVAVFDAAPDRTTPDGYPDYDGFDPVTEYYYYYYFSNDLVEKTTAVAVSDVKENETYGTYTPPPYIVYDTDSTDNFSAIRVISDSMRKGNTNLMDPKNAFTLTATYNQDLHIIDESKPIGISFTSIHPNTQIYAFFVPFEKDENGEDVYVHLLDDNRTLEFKFCPSLMYEHNKEDYNFFFTNVGSNELVMLKDKDGNLYEGTSNKLPNSPLFCFERTYMACPKMFNYDGRLWVDVCAQPQLVANSDLSAMDFLDENGESTFSENERSQMMLVAERASTSTENAMLDGIDGIEGSNVTSDDVITSTTYDIYLQMCNQTPVIPDGSYVKLALGFPEGFGPDDEGVTFKIYHRKHVQGDEYIIEEVPCVVTQFGIVVVCTSFSPYMVAVVDEAFATTKNVYASIEGKGGTLTNEDGRIQSLSEGDSYTYTIQPDNGYMVYSVTLNGVEVSDRITNDGKLTVTYDELVANNQVVIQYIANEAAARIQQKLASNEIDTAIEVSKAIVSVDGAVSANTSMPGNSNVNPDNFVAVDKPVVDDGSGDNNESNVPGPGTSTDIGNTGNSGNGSGNGALTAIVVVSVVIVVAVAAALVVVVIRKKKN